MDTDELVDRVARIIAEFPDGWEWPGTANAAAVAKYRDLARKALAAAIPAPDELCQAALEMAGYAIRENRPNGDFPICVNDLKAAIAAYLEHAAERASAHEAVDSSVISRG